MYRVKVVFILFLAFLFCFQSISQEWQKWYGVEELDFTNESICEDYDNGILISGNILDFNNSMVFPKIIKTTINGDTLWSKLLINAEYVGLKKIKKTLDGGTMICGGLRINDESKPFAAKLNPCGEKEWCTVFESYRESVYACDIIETSSGDIGVIVNSFDEIDELFLFKLDSSGEFLWEKPVCSREDHPDSRAPYGWSLNVSLSEDFLIAGSVYWKNPWDDLYPVKSLFAMIGNDGVERWVLPFGLHDSIFSHSLNIVEKPDGNFIGLGANWSPSKKNSNDYYISGESNYVKKFDYEFRNGLLVEIDPNGNELNHFIADFANIDPEYKYQVFSDIYFVDSVAIIVGAFDDNQYMNTGEIIIDTSFFDDNFEVYYRIKHDNAYQPFSYALSSDNKVLCASTDLYTSNHYQMYLTKLNRYLEQDSIYTINYEYDYLCDHEIESGTIYFDDCNIILATDETPIHKEYLEQLHQVKIKMAPNPVIEKINLSFENTENYQQLDLYITSALGQQVYEKTLFKEQTECEIAIKNWQQGVYLVQLYSNGKIIGQNRFVKM